MLRMGLLNIWTHPNKFGVCNPLQVNESLELGVSLYDVNVCTTKCLTGELVYSNDLI